MERPRPVMESVTDKCAGTQSRTLSQGHVRSSDLFFTKRAPARRYFLPPIASTAHTLSPSSHSSPPAGVLATTARWALLYSHDEEETRKDVQFGCVGSSSTRREGLRKRTATRVRWKYGQQCMQGKRRVQKRARTRIHLYIHTDNTFTCIDRVKIPVWILFCADSCMHVCMHACMHICMHVCMHVCTNGRIHTHPVQKLSSPYIGCLGVC